MAEQSPPYAIQAASHGAAVFRQSITAAFGLTQPGTLTAANGGVVNSGDLAVSALGTPNMSVNVAGGVAVIPQTIAANGGVYTGLNDATVNRVVSAANSSNPRIDKVVATVNDAAYSGGTNNWIIQVITGTATAGASLSNLNGAPATPASSILIAYILVPTSAPSIINGDLLDERTFIGGTTGGTPAANLIGAATSLPSSTTEVVGMNATPDYLKGGMTYNGTNTMAVPVNGIYHVSCLVTWDGNAQTGISFVQVITGASTVLRRWNLTTNGVAFNSIGGAFDVNLAAGAAIFLEANGASNGNSQGGINNTWFSCHLVSR